MTYLDHAATSHPTPPAVAEAMARALADCGNPGRGAYALARDGQQVIDRARRAVARLVGAPDARRVVLTSGATFALNLAIRGLVEAGDRVLVTELEHNSVLRPVEHLRERGIVESTVLPCPGGGPVDLEALDEALAGGDVALCCVSHASNVTGVVQPVPAIARRTREAGALLLVDAAQTAGHLPLSVEDLEADLLAIAGHKGPHGPAGTGALWIREGVSPEPLVTGGTGTRSSEVTPPRDVPVGLEAGTANVPGLAGLTAGIEWVLDRGVGSIARDGARRREEMVRELAGVEGVVVHDPPAPAHVPVVSFGIEGLPPTDAAAVLEARHDVAVRAGLHCAPLACRALEAPEGTVRASAGPDTTPGDVDRLVSAVRDVAAGVRGRSR